MDLLKETYRIWAMHREFRAVLRELAGYSERELVELGIARGDIPRVAMEEAERRVGGPETVPATLPSRADWRAPLAAAAK